jgi:hypothetical protein
MKRDLRIELLDRVKDQLRDGDPPAAVEAFQRLQRLGRTSDEALDLLAAALLVETHAMARDGRPFDHEGYARGLAALPRILKR